MTIQRTENKVIMRLPANVTIDGSQRLLNVFTYQEITAKSQASQEEVDELPINDNKGWWAKNAE